MSMTARMVICIRFGLKMRNSYIPVVSMIEAPGVYADIVPRSIFFVW